MLQFLGSGRPCSLCLLLTMDGAIRKRLLLIATPILDLFPLYLHSLVKTSPRWTPPDWMEGDVLRAATDIQFGDDFFFL